jgi:hypothetical protein
MGQTYKHLHLILRLKRIRDVENHSALVVLAGQEKEERLLVKDGDANGICKKRMRLM